MNLRRLVSGRWLFRRLNRLRGLPTRAHIEVTSRCNCKCVYCRSLLEKTPDFSGNGRDMTIEEFDTLLRRLPSVERFLLSGVGEPFLNPNLFDMISMVSRRGKVSMVETNGTLLGEETCVEVVKCGLRKLSFSIDSADPDTFERLRKGARFQEVVDNIKIMVETKRRLGSLTPHLIINVVASRDNQGELGELLHLAHSLGVQAVRIKSLYAPFPELRERRVPAAERRRIIIELGRLAEKLQIRLLTLPFAPGCQKHEQLRDLYITLDGYVSPCFYVYYPEKVQFGNLFQEGFASVWRRHPYRQSSTGKSSRKGPKCGRACLGTATVGEERSSGLGFSWANDGDSDNV